MSGICRKCGGPLPKDRTAFCRECRPNQGWKLKPTEDHKTAPEYTLEDIAAIAESYGLSYGKYQMYLQAGLALPPQQHPVQWPRGSKHAPKEPKRRGRLPKNAKKVPV